MISQEELGLFVDAVAKRRDADSCSAKFFREYLVKSLTIFDRHNASGWPFHPLSEILSQDGESWKEVESIIERLIEGGSTGKYWLLIVLSGRIVFPEGE
ncbi:hypothetical protein [Chromobacterium phragmitis]|uniref:hypothetical protein n=1 Tax=Chromobacterium phragmitis TaxID=2202141 RepID=UPI0011AE2DB0|nr:hypothetical protein [Chromobacterium phragmitis]